MIANRRFTAKRLFLFALPSLTQTIAWATVVYLLYTVAGFDWLRIPFLPLSVIGTAVAFYIGFKNNSSYDRFWEGRKIWGGIVNESRTWTNQVLCQVMPGDQGEEATQIRRRLVYRHLAWINALRLQLRRSSRFFDRPARGTRIRLENHAEHMRNDWDAELSPFLSSEEHAAVGAMINPATHLVVRQGQELADLLSAGRLELFHQVAMMEVLRALYDLQGKCERIKATPFPRQYAEISRVFVKVYVLLVPFGLLDVFSDHIQTFDPIAFASDPIAYAAGLLWLLPFLTSAALIGWVFLTMEAIGDASEDPFERSLNDVPMNALCRVIERDLRQLLGETDVPDAEAPIDGVLY